MSYLFLLLYFDEVKLLNKIIVITLHLIRQIILEIFYLKRYVYFISLISYYTSLESIYYYKKKKKLKGSGNFLFGKKYTKNKLQKLYD